MSIRARVFAAGPKLALSSLSHTVITLKSQIRMLFVLSFTFTHALDSKRYGSIRECIFHRRGETVFVFLCLSAHI